MAHTILRISLAAAFIAAIAATPAAAQDETTATPAPPAAATTPTVESQVSACPEFPAGPVNDDDLKRLVPDDAAGRVFIRWRTETQEDNYGFNIHRADAADGPYKKVNTGIIPGEGTTNIPRSYCFVDSPLPRGTTFFYFIESVSNQGVAEVVEGTKGTKVKVKTVAEEREWMRKKINKTDEATSSPLIKSADATTSAARRPARPAVQTITVPASAPAPPSDPIN